MQLVDLIAQILSAIVAWFKLAEKPSIGTGAGALAATAYLLAY